MQEATSVWGIWEISVSSLQFFWEPKTILKIKVFIKKKQNLWMILVS